MMTNIVVIFSSSMEMHIPTMQYEPIIIETQAMAVIASEEKTQMCDSRQGEGSERNNNYYTW